MLLRYSNDIFSESYIATIGVDFKIRTIDIGGKKVKLSIWDTAGQERFRTITSSYYKGAHGIMVVFDVNDSESFNNVSEWITEIQKHTNGKAERLLIGNKCDSNSRRVSYEDAQQLADYLGELIIQL